MSKKKKVMWSIAKEKGCVCQNEYYWFQLRDGTVGCNECEKLLITNVEYKEMEQKMVD